MDIYNGASIMGGKMRLSEKQREFANQVGTMILWAYANGMEITLGEVYRTDEQQTYYIQKGMSRVARSKHQDKLAVDINLFIDDKYTNDKRDYRRLGEFWESLGGSWGGRFGIQPEDYDTEIGWDSGHFEHGDTA